MRTIASVLPLYMAQTLAGDIGQLAVDNAIKQYLKEMSQALAGGIGQLDSTPYRIHTTPDDRQEFFHGIITSDGEPLELFLEQLSTLRQML